MKLLKILFYLLVIILSACTDKRTAIWQGKGIEPPTWIKKLPKNDYYIYSVGSCPRTFDPQDARVNSADNARLELAKSIEVRIKSTFISKQSDSSSIFSGDGVANNFLLEVTSEIVDVVLKNSEIESTWLDYTGLIGPNETAYSLVRMPKKLIIQGMKDKAVEKKFNDNREIEAKVDKMLDELDKELK